MTTEAMSAREWIDAAQARCDRATPGPWRAPETPVPSWHNPSVIRGGAASVNESMPTDWIAEAGPADANGQADAEFIAAARADLPRALAALRKVLEMHVPEGREELDGYFVTLCRECAENVEEGPCPSVRAITDALGGAE